MPTLSDHDSHLYIRDDSGGLLVGCFEPMGKAIDPEIVGRNRPFELLPEDWDHFEPMMQNALHRLPALADAEVKMLLNGPESFTPDGSFLLGESAETSGFYLGCGMNSVGVATGGGAGMALAHCIVDGHTPVDLHELDPKRFAPCFSDVSVLAARAPEVLGKHYEISYPAQFMATARYLKATPLDAQWRQQGAHFGQYYGWERPLFFNKLAEPRLSFAKPDWFDQVAEEVSQAHQRAAIFDQSTLGKIRVTGADSESFLQRVCSNRMNRPPGSASYTALLNERGGFESDLTALRNSPADYLLYTGSGAIARDIAWLRRSIKSTEKVSLQDVTAEHATLALMGPKSADVLRAVGADSLLQLNYFQHTHNASLPVQIGGVKVDAARLSYVGEAGWEISCRTDDVLPVYEALYTAGAVPAGLFAQTSMRIEKGFAAYGHELDTDITPWHTGHEFAVDFSKEFIGREALLALSDKPADSRLITIVLDDREAVPLGNEPVLCNGVIIGKSTSTAFGYRIGRPLALAQIKTDASLFAISATGNVSAEQLEGLRVEIDIAGVAQPGSVSLKAAFDPAGARMRAGI